MGNAAGSGWGHVGTHTEPGGDSAQGRDPLICSRERWRCARRSDSWGGGGGAVSSGCGVCAQPPQTLFSTLPKKKHKKTAKPATGGSGARAQGCSSRGLYQHRHLWGGNTSVSLIKCLRANSARGFVLVFALGLQGSPHQGPLFQALLLKYGATPGDSGVCFEQGAELPVPPEPAPAASPVSDPSSAAHADQLQFVREITIYFRLVRL